MPASQPRRPTAPSWTGPAGATRRLRSSEHFIHRTETAELGPSCSVRRAVGERPLFAHWPKTGVDSNQEGGDRSCGTAVGALLTLYFGRYVEQCIGARDGIHFEQCQGTLLNEPSPLLQHGVEFPRLQHVVREKPFLEIGFRIGRLVAGLLEPSVRRDVGLIRLSLSRRK
jgi:hypothetical protein